ncbi:hypothetical protein J7G16_004202 [Vibrio parahaemolyticus]|nr:hypothetical protein [Vibrio parahaemolyticus]
MIQLRCCSSLIFSLIFLAPLTSMANEYEEFAEQHKKLAEEHSVMTSEYEVLAKKSAEAQERNENVDGSREVDEVDTVDNSFPYVFKVGGGVYNPLEDDSFGSSDSTLVGYGELGVGYQFESGVETMLFGRYINNELNPGFNIGYFVPVSEKNSIYFNGGIAYSDSYGSLPNFGFGVDHKLESNLSFYMESVFQSDANDNQIGIGIGLRFGNNNGSSAGATETTIEVYDKFETVIEEPEVESEPVELEEVESVKPEQMPKPQPEEKPVVTSSQRIMQSCNSYVSVRKDDWLYKIADREGVSHEMIRILNIDYYNNLNQLEVGDLICLSK